MRKAKRNPGFFSLVKGHSILATCVLAILLNQNLKAQEGADFQKSSIGESTLKGVNLSTGALNFTVPLIYAPGFELPFQMNAIHSGTGVRPAEVEGVLGPGWQLETNFGLTRIINDLADEINQPTMKGWNYHADVINQTIASKVAAFSPFTIGTSASNFYETIRPLTSRLTSSETRYDASPDFYILNLGGKVFKFVFPVVLNKTYGQVDPWGVCLDLGAEVTLQRTSYGFVANENGNIYVFGSAEYDGYEEEAENFPLSDGTSRPSKNILGLHLSINTFYTKWNLTSFKPSSGSGGFSISYLEKEGNYIKVDDRLSVFPGTNGYVWRRKIDGHVYYKRNLISSIGCSAGIVNISYQDGRMQSVNFQPVLHGKIYQSHLTYQSKNNQRVELEYIRNLISGSEKKSQKFEYWGDLESFTFNCPQVDRFGYFNGDNTIDGNSFPVIEAKTRPEWSSSIYLNRTEVSQALSTVTNRNLDNHSLEFVRVMTLKSVKISTGVLTEFDYELNSAKLNISDLTHTYSGGLRIKKIKTSGFGKFTNEIEESTYFYDNDEVSSAVYCGNYPTHYNFYSFRGCDENQEKYNNDGASLYLNYPGTMANFEGRQIVYGKVEVLRQDGSKTIHTYSLPQKKYSSYLHTIQDRYNVFINFTDIVKQPNAFPMDDLLGGLLSTIAEYDLDGSLLSQSTFYYNTKSEQLKISGQDLWYCSAVPASNGSVTYCNGGDYDWVNEKARIQFVLLPYFKSFVACTLTITNSPKSGYKREEILYGPSLNNLKSIVRETSLRKTFERYLYKEDVIDNVGSSPDPLVQAFMSLPKNLPIVKFEGLILGGIEIVLSATAYEYRHDLLSNRGFPFSVRYPIRTHQFNGKANYSDFVAPKLIMGSLGANYEFDLKFQLTATSQVDRYKTLVAASSGGVGSCVELSHGHKIPAFTARNIDPESYWIDNMEGSYISTYQGINTQGYIGSVDEGLFGTELNPTTSNSNYWPSRDSESTFIVLFGEDYKPYIKLKPDRFDEGVHLSFKYRKNEFSPAFSNGSILTLSITSSTGALINSIPITLAPGDNWTHFFRKFSKSEIFGSSDPSSFVFVKAKFNISGATNLGLDVDNIILANSGARVNLSSFSQDGLILYSEDQFGKSSSLESDCQNFRTIQRNHKGDIQSISTEKSLIKN